MKKNKKDNAKIILISVLLVIITIITFLVINIVKDNSYSIVLNEGNEVTIYEEEEFIDPGYTIYDKNNNIVQEQVNIKGSINNKIPGDYYLTYKITKFLISSKVKRKITVLENPVKSANLSLIGEQTININLKQEYVDQGATCINKNIDCTNDLTTDTNLNTNKLGSYFYDYIYKIATKFVKITRNIIVNGENYSYILSNSNNTNTDISLSVISNLNEKEFKSITGPDNNTYETDTVIYNITQNGDYIFYINKIDNTNIEAKISITNIDKEQPKGTCEAYVEKNKTTYTLNVTDNIGVQKYIFNNQEYTTNFSINSKVTGGDVIAYDKAGNSNNIKCNYVYAPIKKSNTYDSYESDTLKFYIIKNENEYLMYAWMKEPNKQIKSGLGGNPSGLRKVNDILNSEISNNGLSSKGLIAVNASFFTSYNFDSYLYDYDKAWRNTQIGPVSFYNGKVLRDFTKYQTKISRGFDLLGVTKDNQLKKYTIKGYSSLNDAQKVIQKMKDDGIQNSFSFQPVLIDKGVVKVGNSEKASRSAICQIDNNNFILYSSRSLITLGTEAQALANSGCVTAFNLDGGGSRNGYYKKGNSGLQSLTVTSREVADVIYFREQ